ncbi:MAG: C10 family peptidase [Muribaculaceae bacterium]|nr:C10 family peptidase [Muribaculaceae bacterium]
MKHFNLYIAAASLIFGSSLCIASPRSRTSITNLAAAELQKLPSSYINRESTIQEIFSNDNLSVMGLPERGYAIISRDDRQPAVLAVSSGKFNPEENPGLKWWLHATSSLLESSRSNDGPLKFPRPNPELYPDHVDPLTTSAWGQYSPYNDLCPYDDYYGDKDMAGCVATAVSQVLYYNKFPYSGIGTRSLTLKDGQVITVDFDQTPFEWENMLDDYKGDYTDVQANAVASLVYCVGVAVNMNYGYFASNTSAKEATKGLREYLQYPSARVLYRNANKDSYWMDLVYNELLDGVPIIYNGTDEVMGAHSFVIDGYRADGMVHVNWGWDGDSDGWFEIPGLTLDGAYYTSYQSMIIGLHTPYADREVIELDSPTPGSLEQILKDHSSSLALKITGNLNESDISALRTLAGKMPDGRRSNGALQYIDLSDARFIDGKLPDHAFAGSTSLRKVILPSTLDYVGIGAFAMCPYLESVEMPQSGAGFERDGEAVYSNDRSELIAVLPGGEDGIIIPEGVIRVCDEAFSGRTTLRWIDLPSSIKEIGDEAFKLCYGLSDITLRARQVPETGYDVLNSVVVSECNLHVYGGSRKNYLPHHEWGKFVGSDNSGSARLEYDNIIEFGTIVTARNAVRNYGEENPMFGYKIEGDALIGRPEISCEATEESAPGTYPIMLSRGSVINEDVEFIDGVLTILAPAGIGGITASGEESKETTGFSTDGLRVQSKSYKGIMIRKDGKKIVK